MLGQLLFGNLTLKAIPLDAPIIMAAGVFMIITFIVVMALITVFLMRL
jgi:hypothetical protein